MIDRRALLLIWTVSLTLAGCGQPGASTTSQPQTAAVPSESSAPTVPPTSKESELIAAAVKGDNVEIAKLLADGVNVNAKDEQGGTALAHAAWFGHLDTVNLLLEKGADVNAKKNDGATPLLLATWNKHPDVAEVLTKAGAK
jgi:ankyrin repeat protein